MSHVVDTAFQVINWAYRGKEGVDAWTGEKDYISGIRITLHDLQDLIKKQEHEDTAIFTALLNERSERVCNRNLRGVNHHMKIS